VWDAFKEKIEIIAARFDVERKFLHAERFHWFERLADRGQQILAAAE